MAIIPKAAALAALLGGTVEFGTCWAQTTAPTTPPTDAAGTEASTATEAPANDGAANDGAANDGAAAATPAADTSPDAVPTAEGAAGGSTAAPADTSETAGTAATAEAPAAQDTAAQGAAPAAAQGTAAPASTPPAGPAASRDAASVGQYYVDSTHGDWTLRCIKAPEGTDPCELYQLLKDAKGNSVSEVSIIPLQGEAAAGATVVAPLETDLVAGLGLKVDTGRQLGYPFNFCAPVGCVARIGFTKAELDAMKRGNAATVSLLPYGAEAEQRVDLNLSLKGFTAGFDAVTAKMPEPPKAATE